MTLGELFAEIAKAIRYKDGSTGSIPALSFPARIRAISGEGGGGGGPFCQVTVMEGLDGEIVNVPVNISAEVSVTAEELELPKTHALYNGVRLPNIPEDELAVCPYCFIRYNGTDYQLFMLDCPWVYSGGYAYANKSSGTVKYRQYKAGSDAWAYLAGSDAAGLPASWYVSVGGWTLVFSSHDMLISGTTDVYFEGTEPVPTE